MLLSQKYTRAPGVVAIDGLGARAGVANKQVHCQLSSQHGKQAVWPAAVL